VALLNANAADRALCESAFKLIGGDRFSASVDRLAPKRKRIIHDDHRSYTSDHSAVRRVSDDNIITSGYDTHPNRVTPIYQMSLTRVGYGSQPMAYLGGASGHGPPGDFSDHIYVYAPQTKMLF